VGLAVGDALGTTLEFKPRDSYTHVTDIVGGGPFGLNAGEWTDDTSMALCLADSLLERRALDPADLMERFRRWRDEGHNSVNGRCFDIGITTSQSIGRYVRTRNPLAGSTDPGAAGNGSIMRLAPVPIFHGTDVDAAEAAAVLQSRTTHGSAECVESCRLMTRILVALLNGEPWDRAIAVDAGLFAAPKVKAIAGGDWKAKTRAAIKSSGYVIDTLEAALWAVDTTGDFAGALLLAVNLGGDADTVGAVTGQFAGARYGLLGIPEAWRAQLAWHDRIVALAQALRAS
jgi:ADP-ribosyl-[dinitrogen reductase] hydrolase